MKSRFSFLELRKRSLRRTKVSLTLGSRMSWCQKEPPQRIGKTSKEPTGCVVPSQSKKSSKLFSNLKSIDV